MEQKIKIALIGLAAIICALVFGLFIVKNSEQNMLREKQALEKDRDSLVAQLSEAIQDKKRIEDKVNAVNSELAKLTQKNDELEKKYTEVDNQRQELADKLKKLKEQRPEAAAQLQPAEAPKSQAEDTYWAGILKAKTDMEIKLEVFRSELKSIQITNEQLQREKSAYELELKGLKRQQQDYQRQLEYNQKLIDSLSQELVREKNDKFQIQESTRSIKSENTTLRRQLNSLISRKIALERKLADIQDKNRSFESRFNEMDLMLKEKMSQIDNLKSQLYAKPSSASSAVAEKESSVELPPIVVRPKQEEQEHVSGMSLIGKVMALNKDNNFIIIDLGEDAGVKVGDSLQVYREGKSIATVEVIQSRKSISACDIKKETAPIKVGDIVK